MPQGRIVKGIGGFYYVYCQNEVVECKVRGKFRNKKITPIIGDNVIIEINDGKGIIVEILERKNVLVRPPVANIDQVVIVIASTYPAPNLVLVDKLITFLESSRIESILCINKIDLDTQQNYKEILKVYGNIGYKVICTSAKGNIGIDQLKEILKDKVTTFAGSSGVGKSTLLNLLISHSKVQTGELSAKIDRGKHTTRHVELFDLCDGGYVLDTPGFSMFELEKFEKEEIKYYFKEFENYEHECKFTGCNHIHEPGCGVKYALENNLIDKGRYERYKNIFETFKSNNYK